MSENGTLSAFERYLRSIQTLQNRLLESQRPVLERAAGRMAETVRQGRRIFVFGTGHSHMLVEEAFYRAGGLAAVVPVFSAALMLHENPAFGSRLERTAGLAGPLLDGYHPQAGEMMFIFSNSGVNHLPVEMALEARQRGLFVVSVSSLAYARRAPLSALGQRLDEVADLAIDNGGEPGDALLPIPGRDARVAPSSTVIGALIWNGLVAETIYRLQAAGEEPPVFVSFNIPGGEARNAALLEKWRAGNKHL